MKSLLVMLTFYENMVEKWLILSRRVAPQLDYVSFLEGRCHSFLEVLYIQTSSIHSRRSK